MSWTKKYCLRKRSVTESVEFATRPVEGLLWSCPSLLKDSETETKGSINEIIGFEVYVREVLCLGFSATNTSITIQRHLNM